VRNQLVVGDRLRCCHEISRRWVASALDRIRCRRNPCTLHAGTTGSKRHLLQLQ
jgi:hypothetical protein